MKYTGHLRRHTAKKCPQRIKDTPAVLFYRIPCIYTVYFKRRWRDGFTKPLLKILNWNDELDLSCDELYENRKTIKTPFDGLIAMSDATLLWGLHESTLRKAIAYGKLVNGIDACKYGKQWGISAEAMKREYGQPVN